MANFTKRQWLTLIVIGTADFCNGICLSLQAPFYPAEAEKKGCSATEYGLVFSIYEFVIFVVGPMLGHYLNKIGPKSIFSGGIYTMGSCSILFGFLDKVEGKLPFIILSFAIRIVDGIGKAAFVTATFAIIAKEFPYKVATICACAGTFAGLGLLVGPIVGGALFQIGGYTLPFAVMGSAMFAPAVLATMILPNREPETNKTKGPSVILVFKIPGLLLTIVSLIVTSTSISFLHATLEPHLRVFHLAPISLGLVFMIQGCSYSVAMAAWGWLCDHLYTPKIVTVAGTILIATGVCLIGPAPFIPFPTIFWLTITGLVIYGLGIAAQFASSFGDALKTATMHGFPNNQETHALLSGLWASTFSFGAFIGPSIAGILYDTVGFRKASMLIVAINLLVGVANVIFLMMTEQSSSGYVAIKGDCKLPQSHVSDSVRSLRPIANGISNPVECNSYKAQVRDERDASPLGFCSHTYGAVNSKSVA